MNGNLVFDTSRNGGFTDLRTLKHLTKIPAGAILMGGAIKEGVSK